MKNLIFASKDNTWSNVLFNKLLSDNPQWTFVKDSESLYSLNLDTVSYIFFFHWPDIVSSRVYENCECVVVHTSNLPHGKGGSPLQNQIIDRVVQTKVNLLKMTKEIDGGDIYCSSSITLQGSLYDVWMSIATVTEGLILDVLTTPPSPQRQSSTTMTPYKTKN